MFIDNLSVNKKRFKEMLTKLEVIELGYKNKVLIFCLMNRDLSYFKNLKIILVDQVQRNYKNIQFLIFEINLWLLIISLLNLTQGKSVINARFTFKRNNKTEQHSTYYCYGR